MPKALLIFFGGLALILGGTFTAIGWKSRKEVIRIAALPRLGHADLLRDDLDREGLLIGRLSRRNRLLKRDFVLYFKSRLVGMSKDQAGNRRPTWKLLDRQLPPLEIDIGGAVMPISEDYAVTFKGSDPTWISTEELEVGVTDKLEGLEAGQEVVVVGKAIAGDGGRTFVAERLVSGSYQEFVDGETSAAKLGLIAGGILLLIALVLLTIVIFGL